MSIRISFCLLKESEVVREYAVKDVLAMLLDALRANDWDVPKAEKAIEKAFSRALNRG